MKEEEERLSLHLTLIHPFPADSSQPFRKHRIESAPQKGRRINRG